MFTVQCFASLNFSFFKFLITVRYFCVYVVKVQFYNFIFFNFLLWFRFVFLVNVLSQFSCHIKLQILEEICEYLI